MQGLGRRYSNTEQQVLNGHCLLAELYVLLGQRCPLEPRLYRQKLVCERSVFQSKMGMVVQAIQQFESVEGTYTCLLVDTWYRCRRVRQEAQKHGCDVSDGLKSNRRMRPSVRTAAAAGSLWRSCGSTRPNDWQEVEWPSQGGGQKVHAHVVRMFIRKLGPVAPLITSRDVLEPAKFIRYRGSTLLDANVQTLINGLAARWCVEFFSEDAKDLLASDHYQLMKAEAILQF